MIMPVLGREASPPASVTPETDHRLTSDEEDDCSSRGDESVDLFMRLEEDLVIEILRRLPVPCIFRLRSVSRTWNSILCRSSFLKILIGPTQRFPLFIQAVDHKTNFAIYNPESARWNCCRYDVLLPRSFKERFPSMFARSLVRAVVSGIFLLEEVGIFGSWFLVNPSNDSHRKLPILAPADETATRLLVMGMDVNTEKGDCKILVQSSAPIAALRHRPNRFGPMDARETQSRHYYVYDLKDDAWEMIFDDSKALPAVPPDYNCFPAVLREGFWYHISYTKGPITFYSSPTPHIIRFKLGESEEIKAPPPRQSGSSLRFLNLFQRNGRLMMAGGAKRKDYKFLREWTSFRLWQLDDENLDWVEIVRVPQHLLQNFSFGRPQFKYALDISCALDGDFLCLWAVNRRGYNNHNQEEEFDPEVDGGVESQLQQSSLHQDSLSNFFLAHSKDDSLVKVVQSAKECWGEDDYDYTNYAYEKKEIAICDLSDDSWWRLRLNSLEKFPGNTLAGGSGGIHDHEQHLGNFLFKPNFIFALYRSSDH